MENMENMGNHEHECNGVAIQQVTPTQFRYQVGEYTFVFRSLKSAKRAIYRYYRQFPCEVYAADGQVIDAERGGPWRDISKTDSALL